MTQFDHMLHCFTPKNDDEPIIKDNPRKENNPIRKNKQGIAETAKTNGPTCDNMCIQKI